jgi:outer membrane autotransporter protein
LAKEKHGRSNTYKKNLSIIMAMINGINTAAPLSLPLAVAAADIPVPSARKSTLENSLITSFNRGGQILDYLFFTTAHAGETVSGTKNVASGETADGDTIEGGIQKVLSGGSATRTTINTVGMQIVSSGGNASITTINKWGTQFVVGGGSATSTTINSGGIQQVDSGGSASGTTINNGGIQEVYGSATSTTINNGGTQDVFGSASGTTINNGGVQNVNGSASGTTINSGGTQTVSGGGSANGTTIAGGIQNVSGSVSGTTITSDGTQNLYSGATATDTTIYACAQNVSGGATASATTIHSGGTQNVLAGGTAVSTTVNNGGSQYVYSGGAASATTVNTGGIEYVYSGGTTTNTSVSGGTLNLEAGAAVSGTTTLSTGTIALIGDGSYAIGSLTANGGTVKLASVSGVGRNLAITNLSGSANFVINTNLAAGMADTITVTAATASTANTVKVNYDPIYLTGASASGAATFATTPGGVTFTAVASQYGAYTYTPTLTETTAAATTTWQVTALTVNGASETVKTGADVAGGSLVAWRAENNNLTKRMGELRNATGEAGMWLRTYRGAQEIAGSGGRQTMQQYTALQGGYDQKVAVGEDTFFTGWALGYLEGSNSYERGTGDARSVSAGAYYSWLGKKGHFLDFIAKVGRLRNSYTNYLNDANSTKVDGSYNNWGTSLSAEYGLRRQLKDNWYVEPQAELTLSRINGVSYTASDGTSIKNDDVNSLAGRVGVAVGRQVGSTHYYGKVSLAREFTAKASITAASGGLAPVDMRQDLKESWLEFALGLTGKLGGRTDGYLEVTRTTGDKAKTPWQVNVGARWNF